MTAKQSLLGQAIELHRVGKVVDAASLFEGILKGDPENLAALQHLAIIHANKGEFEPAEQLFRRAAKAAPASAEAHSNLGRVLTARGHYGEAADCFQRALALRPGMVEAEFNLGALHRKLGHSGLAIEHLQRVVAQRPDFSAAHCLLAVALHEDGKGVEAISLLEQAIAERPQDAALLHALGRLRSSDGDAVEARKNFERAIALRPGLGVAYYDLSRIYRFEVNDPKIGTMERLLGHPQGLGLDERVGLNLALYKAFTDTDRNDKAFTHLTTANAARRYVIPYDEQRVVSRYRAIRRAFDNSLFARYARAGFRSRLPVFVVGFPRSGTTLVEQILASHPQALGAGELPRIGELENQLAGPGIPFSEMVNDETARLLADLGESYVMHLTRLAPGAARVVDKMPENFRRLGLIHLILPEAAIIHVRRDPMDTCFSCFENDFGDRLSFTYDMSELGRRYCMYQGMMVHWRNVLPPGRVLEVEYERLVADLEGEVRRLLAHCGLDWDERCLNFHETRRAVFTQSQAQVRQPLYASSVGRWRRFERQLAPLAAALQESVVW